MLYEASYIAVILFIGFVVLVLGLSFYFARKTKSSSGYFAAGGTIHWAVNGIAFAGDYLSAASFLGICGMIAFVGYDGFLYSIGYLAGWIVALFLVAEPLKRLGKYTFTDALDAKFNSRAIQLTAALSTLIVSIFYLIPQMVGAGVLITPLLGFEHYVGVIIVGAIVIFIVATAGMTSTTYVQFLKGGLLIVFSTILAFYILNNGLTLHPENHGQKYHDYITLNMTEVDGENVITDEGWTYVGSQEIKGMNFIKVKNDEGVIRWFNQGEEIINETVNEIVKIDSVMVDDSLVVNEVVETETITEKAYPLSEMLSITSKEDIKLYNGEPKENAKFYQVGHMSKIIVDGVEVDSTGSIGPFKFLSTINASEVIRFIKESFDDEEGNKVTVWYQKATAGASMMQPGLKFHIGKDSTFMEKLNFISLMIALFLGTSALPHILIRYYTVPSQKDARKSTIVAIAAIGFFYILTLFMGLGAAVGGVLDVESTNMSGPLLAKAFGIGLFSIISAIAFATILGTVSGLIVASSGAIAHDFIDRYLKKNLSDKAKVKAGKIAAFAVGIVAIILGILFKGMNVSFLVGWAFAVAASANLPAILMVLFWKKTTAKGVAWSIVVGIVTALGIIMTGPTIGAQFFGIDKADAIQPLDAPAIISFTAALLTLVIISLLTQKDNATKNHNSEQE